jgi:hypothetical protein
MTNRRVPVLAPSCPPRQRVAPRVSPPANKPPPRGHRIAAEFTASSPASTVRRRRVHARISRRSTLRPVHVGGLGIRAHHPVVHPLVAQVPRERATGTNRLRGRGQGQGDSLHHVVARDDRDWLLATCGRVVVFNSYDDRGRGRASPL